MRDDPREMDLPLRWGEWSYQSRTDYLTLNLSRADLFRAVALEVDPAAPDPSEISAQSRFTKEQIARIALHLGLFQ